MIKIDKNINKAKTLSPEFYSGVNFFDQSKSIFNDSIQPICSIYELNGISIYPFTYLPDFLDEPLLITIQDKIIKCMPNVCTHRGHILSVCNGNDNSLQCRYHGRTFDLNGKLKNAPGFQGALDFPANDDNLEQLPIENWNNFLFISLSENKKIFNKLSQINDFLPNFPYLDLCQTPVKNEYLINCHWSLYCDNYLEGFHIPYVHKGLNNDMDWHNYETQILNEIVLQKATSKDKDNVILYDGNDNIYAYYFFIFPNIMINYYSWGISINIVEPISPTRTRIKYMIYGLNGEKIPKDSSSSVDTVELEDQEVVLSVQKGIKSRYYKSGRFSPKMEKGVHYFHRLISEKLLNFNKGSNKRK